jgi:hypothetical protein
MPYIAYYNGLTVGGGTTLTIGPGAIVKFDGTGSYLYVNGVLNAEGTEANEIYFTSLEDDEHGGDTNGAAGTPEPGNWNGIIFNSGSTGTLPGIPRWLCGDPIIGSARVRGRGRLACKNRPPGGFRVKDVMLR